VLFAAIIGVFDILSTGLSEKIEILSQFLILTYCCLAVAAQSKADIVCLRLPSHVSGRFANRRIGHASLAGRH
jgi:hypothetical protein